MNYILLLLFIELCLDSLWMKRQKEKPLISLQWRNYAVGLIFLLGILIRVLYFWEMPWGLNQDEASIGYDIYADLTYGMDRNGYHNPVYSVAWGSGHSSLYIFLSKPWVAAFGLNLFTVRVVNVLFGVSALFAFYGILNRTKNKRFALLGLFLLAINPWHIMMSRWGLECNLFPNVWIIATYFLVRGYQGQPKYYLLSLLIYALSLYAYGTSYMILPVFLVLMAGYLYYHKKIKISMLGLCASVFLMVAFPLILFMAINVFELEPIRLSWMSFPRLVSGRYNTTITALGENSFQSIGNNIKTTLQMLVSQRDGLIWNSTKPFGTLYLFSLPFVLLGFGRLIKKSGLWKKFEPSFLWIAILFGCLVLGSMTELNINRGNIFYFPLIYLLTEGIWYVGRKITYSKPIICGIFAVAFVFFGIHYFTDYQEQVGRAFFKGAGEAIVYASKQTEGTVYLTDTINAPYIIGMFHLKTHPQVFMDTVDYDDPDAECRYVHSFDRYVTGIPEENDGDEESVYVLAEEELLFFPEEEYELYTFHYYTVAIKRR